MCAEKACPHEYYLLYKSYGFALLIWIPRVSFPMLTHQISALSFCPAYSLILIIMILLDSEVLAVSFGCLIA